MTSFIDPAEVAPAVRAAVLRLGRRLRLERDRAALSNNKVAVLSHLSKTESSTPSRIARAERQHVQSLTRVFADLEAEGLIERRRAGDDARQAELAITPAGSAALDADMGARDAWLARAMRGLSDTDLGVLRLAADILDRLADRSQDEDAGAR